MLSASFILSVSRMLSVYLSVSACLIVSGQADSQGVVGLR